MMATKKAILKDKIPRPTNWTLVHQLVDALEAAWPHVPVGPVSQRVKEALAGVSEAHKLTQRYARVIAEAKQSFVNSNEIAIDDPPLLSECEDGEDQAASGVWLSAAVYFPLSEED